MCSPIKNENVTKPGVKTTKTTVRFSKKATKEQKISKV